MLSSCGICYSPSQPPENPARFLSHMLFPSASAPIAHSAVPLCFVASTCAPFSQAPNNGSIFRNLWRFTKPHMGRRCLFCTCVPVAILTCCLTCSLLLPLVSPLSQRWYRFTDGRAPLCEHRAIAAVAFTAPTCPHLSQHSGCPSTPAHDVKRRAFCFAHQPCT